MRVILPPPSQGQTDDTDAPPQMQCYPNSRSYWSSYQRPKLCVGTLDLLIMSEAQIVGVEFIVVVYVLVNGFISPQLGAT
ncbi:hypothetical protein THAOC_04071 [Thalassiosira oceanica]|uniref:Uncharacterized protein n=1 Tax=Thalassiosira oceanica TaxID=159749 RepID=K0TAY8_THAOC|nr:hypothetical protein THAOC_04071 [Thalassiosira oceanica]|eukprot:EJK74259.1 hypothetical protein THAOC_04071 [Thalassiosira oceanica]